VASGGGRLEDRSSPLFRCALLNFFNFQPFDFNKIDKSAHLYLQAKKSYKRKSTSEKGVFYLQAKKYNRHPTGGVFY
jgi:hypothetical protein